MSTIRFEFKKMVRDGLNPTVKIKNSRIIEIKNSTDSSGDILNLDFTGLNIKFLSDVRERTNSDGKFEFYFGIVAGEVHYEFFSKDESCLRSLRQFIYPLAF